jgi:hypothetical protein
VTGVILERGEVVEVAGIRECIEIDDTFVRLSQPIEKEVAADEAGSASDK